MSHQQDQEFNWQEDIEENSCFDACYEGQSTLSLNGFDFQEVQASCEQTKPPELCYKVIIQGRYAFISTMEQLIDHLSSSISDFFTKQSHPDYRSIFALYHYSPHSFLYLLAENCIELLKEERHQNWITDQVVESAVMMLDCDRFLSNEEKLKKGSRKLMRR